MLIVSNHFLICCACSHINKNPIRLYICDKKIYISVRLSLLYGIFHLFSLVAQQHCVFVFLGLNLNIAVIEVIFIINEDGI